MDKDEACSLFRQQDVIEQKQIRLDSVTKELEQSREAARRLEQELTQQRTLHEAALAELTQQRTLHEAALAELTQKMTQHEVKQADVVQQKIQHDAAQAELDQLRTHLEAMQSELARVNSLNNQLTAVLKVLNVSNSGNTGVYSDKDGSSALERLVTEVTQCNNFISRLQDKVQALETDLEQKERDIVQLTDKLALVQTASCDSGTQSASESHHLGASPISGEVPVPVHGEQWNEELPGSLLDMAKRAQDNDDTVKYQFLKRLAF
jgi:predicted  nucleic acid-binding Zn-ribbon protein